MKRMKRADMASVKSIGSRPVELFRADNLTCLFHSAFAGIP
jgi:hypothetical protein